MSSKVRGTGKPHSPRSIATACIAVLGTSAVCGGAALLASTAVSQPPGAPAFAAAVGFLAAAGVACAIRLRQARRSPAGLGIATRGAVARSGREAKAPPSATDGDRMAVDVSDLAEAIRSARISRILLPLGSGGDAREAITLARRLAAEGASTVLVDFGAQGVARETGLIEPPSDALIIAASPTTFAHSIHRDRASRAHVLSASIEPQAGDRAAMSDAVATVLDALGEAYGRTVVAFPADRLSGVEALIHADTAVVVPASSAGDTATRALLDELRRHGVDDVLLVASEVEARRSVAA